MLRDQLVPRDLLDRLVLLVRKGLRVLQVPKVLLDLQDQPAPKVHKDPLDLLEVQGHLALLAPKDLLV